MEFSVCGSDFYKDGKKSKSYPGQCITFSKMCRVILKQALNMRSKIT